MSVTGFQNGNFDHIGAVGLGAMSLVFTQLERVKRVRIELSSWHAFSDVRVRVVARVVGELPEPEPFELDVPRESKGVLVAFGQDRAVVFGRRGEMGWHETGLESQAFDYGDPDFADKVVGRLWLMSDQLSQAQLGKVGDRAGVVAKAFLSGLNSKLPCVMDGSLLYAYGAGSWSSPMGLAFNVTEDRFNTVVANGAKSMAFADPEAVPKTVEFIRRWCGYLLEHGYGGPVFD